MLDVGQYHPGLHRHRVIDRVDRSHPAQTLQRKHQTRPRRHRRGAAAIAGVAALGHHGNASPSAPRHHLPHLLDVCGPRDHGGLATVQPTMVDQIALAVVERDDPRIADKFGDGSQRLLFR
jgi:hypothetical protein